MAPTMSQDRTGAPGSTARAGAPAGGASEAEDLFYPPRSAGARARALAAAAVHAPEIARTVAAGVRVHGGRRLAAVRRLHMLRRRGYTYDEALRDGMLDPAIPTEDLAGYAPRHVALEAQRAVNPPTLTDLTTEKAIFYRYCTAIGLPVPRPLAIVHRRTAGWGAGDVPLGSGADLAEVLRANPMDIVIKPSDGGKGVFVRVLRLEDGRYWDETGPHDAAALWQAMRTHPEHPCFVVQERLRNHPALAERIPSQALNTIRLAVFQPLRGPVEVSQTVIRLGIGGGPIDNFGDGSDGNGYCEIDPATGRLGPLRMAGPGGVGFREHAVVPGTDTPIQGLTLPHWDEVLELAASAMPHFLPNRSIGWDIAITDRGPVIVEANREWTPFPQADLLGALARIARS